MASVRNTRDHPNATPKCISTPTRAVLGPPLNASVPSRVLATTCHRRVTVEWKTRTLKALANSPSETPVTSPARARRLSVLRSTVECDAAGAVKGSGPDAHDHRYHQPGRAGRKSGRCARKSG